MEGRGTRDVRVRSFSQGSSTESPVVVSNQTRRRQRNAPSALFGGRYGISTPNSTAAVVGVLFQNSSVFVDCG